MVKRWMLPGLLVAWLVLQFVDPIPVEKNPAEAGSPQWDSAQTAELFDRACADCHSHRTRWPWYSKVAPVSWLINHDVDEGRAHFNVSLWGVQKKNKGDEAAEEVNEGDMPPAIYLLMHPEARLTDRQKARLVQGLQATFGRRGR